jgi:hypothetical protein
MLTIFGACALSFMMLMYALERRGRQFILAFACGCALSSLYGFLAGTWPFGVVECVWALIALRRYREPAIDPRARPVRAGEASDSAAPRRPVRGRRRWQSQGKG